MRVVVAEDVELERRTEGSSATSLGEEMKIRTSFGGGSLMSGAVAPSQRSATRLVLSARRTVAHTSKRRRWTADEAMALHAI